MRAICAVASTGHKDTHTRYVVIQCLWVNVCVWDCHTLLCTVRVYESLLCGCQCMSDYMRVSVYVGLSVCVCLWMCVPTATVGCSGWNVCFSAGPVRPLLLNICPQHINSPTLTHPSLPRDHLIEIHNDSFFSSLPHWGKWSWKMYFTKKGHFY